MSEDSEITPERLADALDRHLELIGRQYFASALVLALDLDATLDDVVFILADDLYRSERVVRFIAEGAFPVAFLSVDDKSQFFVELLAWGENQPDPQATKIILHERFASLLVGAGKANWADPGEIPGKGENQAKQRV